MPIIPRSTTLPVALLVALPIACPTTAGAAVPQASPPSGSAASSVEVTPASAQTAPFGVPGGDGEEKGVRFSLAGGYLYQFSASFDEGPGEVAVQRGYGAVGAGFALTPDLDLGLRLAWEGGWYDFDGPSQLSLGTGLRPWNAVQSVQFGGQLGWKLDDAWSLSAGLFGSAAGENDADVGDALSIGGSVGASWRLSEDLMLGGGVLVASQIEKDPLVVPLLFVDWRINEQWRISNVAGPEAYPAGAGLEVIFRPVDAVEFALGGLWEGRRFRLDDDAPSPGGIGEDRALALWLRAGLRPLRPLRVDILGGVMLGQEMSLFDANGAGLASVDVDPAPFIGAFASWRF